MKIIITSLIVILGYLIGSINFSILAGKYFRNQDLRNYYSKNAGATNATRVFGWKYGIVILFLDMCKILIAMSLVLAISCIKQLSSISYYIIGLSVIIGHCFPIFFRFRGGKGVACFIAFTLMTNPLFFIIFIVTFGLLTLLFKKISIASTVSVLMVMLLCWIPQISGITINQIFNSKILFKSWWIWFNTFHRLHNINSNGDTLLTIDIIIFLSGVVIITMHHSNFKKLWFEFKNKTKQK